MRQNLNITILIAIAAGGCATRPVFHYQASPAIQGAPLLNDGVAVFAFEDNRGKHPLNHNLKNLALIPLVPFATSWRDFPERTWFDFTNNLNGFDPARDLSAAFAAEMAAQGIFNKITHHEIGAHGERYELRGHLADTHVSEGLLTYGVSVFSPILHILGLPEGTLRCALKLDVELIDRRDASVVWKQQFDARRTRLTWIYNSAEAEHLCAMFSSLAEEWIRPGVADLRRVIAIRGQK